VGLGRKQRFPSKILNWTPQQVAQAVAAYMLLSEGYVQKAKIAYRQDEAPVIKRWERRALGAAIHAATLESENDEAHGLVKERRARLNALVSQ
jgi:hypothetical protein